MFHHQGESGVAVLRESEAGDHEGEGGDKTTTEAGLREVSLSTFSC